MLNMNSIQRLEEDLMRVFQIKDDVDDVLKYVGDDPFFEGLKPDHQDKLMNLLIGIKELADVRMSSAWESFERATADYYKYKQLSAEKDNG